MQWQTALYYDLRSLISKLELLNRKDRVNSPRRAKVTYYTYPVVKNPLAFTWLSAGSVVYRTSPQFYPPLKSLGLSAGSAITKKNQKTNHDWSLYVVRPSLGLLIERFHMTSRRPYWCPKTMKRPLCWCPMRTRIRLFLVYHRTLALLRTLGFKWQAINFLLRKTFSLVTVWSNHQWSVIR